MRCRVSGRGDQSEKSRTGIKGAKVLGDPVVGRHRSVVHLRPRWVTKDGPSRGRCRQGGYPHAVGERLVNKILVIVLEPARNLSEEKCHACPGRSGTAAVSSGKCHQL